MYSITNFQYFSALVSMLFMGFALGVTVVSWRV